MVAPIVLVAAKALRKDERTAHFITSSPETKKIFSEDSHNRLDSPLPEFVEIHFAVSWLSRRPWHAPFPRPARNPSLSGLHAQPGCRDERPVTVVVLDQHAAPVLANKLGENEYW